MQNHTHFDLVNRSDILVIGGGISGACAAVAAARMGCSVTMVEQSGCAGGSATQSLVGPFMTCYNKSGSEMIIRGMFSEVLDRLIQRQAAIHPSAVRAGTGYTSWIVVGHDHVAPFEPEALKLVLDEMLQEAEVQILYHTVFMNALMDGDRVIGAKVLSKSGEDELYAQVCIDCTGDGDLAVSAGADYVLESDKLQPATMFFRIGNVDSERLEEEIAQHKAEFYRKDGVNYRSLHWRVSQAKQAGDWTLDRVSIGIFKGVKNDEWNINTSRIMGVDATDNVSMSFGEVEGRRQAEEIFKFLKKYVPGCENARLLCTGSSLGIRETRHIIGENILTADDIVSGRVPEDSILVCSNSIDVHGRFGPKSNMYLTVEKGEYYGIPYGCLIPKGVQGLLMAGRMISASSDAAGAVRVMPPCMCMGHAAGAAAALCVKNSVQPQQISTEVLREELKKQGAYLPEG